MLSDNNLLIGDFPKDSEIHANCLGMSSSRPLYTAPEKSESLLAYFGKRGHGEVSRYCFVGLFLVSPGRLVYKVIESRIADNYLFTQNLKSGN